MNTTMRDKKIACNHCKVAKTACIKIDDSRQCNRCIERNTACSFSPKKPSNRKEEWLANSDERISKSAPSVQQRQSNSVVPILLPLIGSENSSSTLSPAKSCYRSSTFMTKPFDVCTTNTPFGNINTQLYSDHPDPLTLQSGYDGLYKYIYHLLENDDDMKATMRYEGVDSQHVLSLDEMQTYFRLYWTNFHPQLPILHKPTFDASTCPGFLLVVIICLGAYFAGSDSSQKLANLLAWEIRYELIKEADSSRGSKLCALQGLVLLEIFEKRYSTCELYNRARANRGHILNRIECLGFFEEDAIRQHAIANTISGTWNIWIATEATRRMVFAAVFMDSIDSILLDCTGKIKYPKIGLRLPCAEEVWTAQQDSWEHQIPSSNDSRAVLFEEGLKNTLNWKSISTGWFGRTVLVVELLAIKFGLEQKSQLDIAFRERTAKMCEVWQQQLPLDFDSWKQDFACASKQPNDYFCLNPHKCFGNINNRIAFEFQTILYHLAYMVTHVDIVDCQIYADASTLPRTRTTQQRFKNAERRVKEWAPTERAQIAIFHAIRLLSHVLVKGGHIQDLKNGTSATLDYSVLEDYLLYSPWALHLATLIVWSYCFALHGSIKESGIPPFENAAKDFKRYLYRVHAVESYGDLKETPNRNICLGLLIIMKDMFMKSRVELLRKAGDLLVQCIRKLF